jgi:hypothetical protein
MVTLSPAARLLHRARRRYLGRRVFSCCRPRTRQAARSFSPFSWRRDGRSSLAMLHALPLPLPPPERENASDSDAHDASPRESGTRRASRPKVGSFGLADDEFDPESERPTLRIRRVTALGGYLEASLRTDGAPVDVSPTAATLSDLVALVEPPRPSGPLPVAEKPAFNARTTLRSIVLPIALDPELAAGDRAEAPGQRVKRTRRDSVIAQARRRSRSEGSLLMRRPSTVSSASLTPPLGDLHSPTSFPPIVVPATPTLALAKADSMPAPLAAMQSPFRRSLRGGRRLTLSRRYVVVAAAVVGLMAAMAGIGRSGSLPVPPLGTDRPVAGESLPGGSAVGPAAVAASAELEPTPHPPVTELPAAASEPSAKPASPGPTHGPAPARAQEGSRPLSKRSKDVDFGI